MTRFGCCLPMGNSKLQVVELREPSRGGLRQALNDQIPVILALLLCQVVSGFYFVGTAVALGNGANSMVLSFYRDLFALVVLVPIAYFWEFRRDNKVDFSVGVVFNLAILGFVGIFGGNYLLFIGINYTSADFAAGLQPVAPVVTAFIAVLFGVERIVLRRRDGQAKLVGIIACLAGGFLMTFWHGSAIFSLNQTMSKASSHCTGKTLQESISELRENALTAETGTWGLSEWQTGVLYVCGNSVATGVFLNMQSPLLKKFPVPFTILSVAYFFGTAFMGVFCFHSVKDTSAYALGFNSNTGIIFYNGIIGSALYFVLMSWTFTRVCPIYVASYNTLQPPVTTFLSVICLGGTAYVTNVVGSVLIFIGLLLTCWALAYEETLIGAAFGLPYTRPTADDAPDHRVKLNPELGARDSLREPLLQRVYGPEAKNTSKESILQDECSRSDRPLLITLI